MIILKKFIPFIPNTRLIMLLTYFSVNVGWCKLKEDSVIQTVVISNKSLEFKNGLVRSSSQFQYFIFDNLSKESIWIKLRMDKSKPFFFVVPGRSSYELKQVLNKALKPVIEVLSPAGNSLELFPNS
ncbi:MAG: hypothetical protein QE271_11645 [Bacteriovoracaceae bacterium]|nr:hypothetical protein [Bacteriovoracaceae bacterium]